MGKMTVEFKYNLKANTITCKGVSVKMDTPDYRDIFEAKVSDKYGSVNLVEAVDKTAKEVKFGNILVSTPNGTTFNSRNK